MDANKAAIVVAILLDSSSSDNSSSDDEIENDERNEGKPKVNGLIHNVVDRYTDLQFKEDFRLSRRTFQFLLYILRPHLEESRAGLGRRTIPAEKQLYLALYVLGTPNSYRSISTIFGEDKATIWRAVMRVVKALYLFRNNFICWPQQNDIIESANRIQRTKKFPGVVGAVDGTLIQITAPKENRQSYVDRKGNYSIQLQIICNAKLEFIHCFTGLPGSVHDMRVFKYSGVQQRCTEAYFPENTHILGDSAYILQKHVMTPYRNDGHLTVEQVYFNKTLSSVRVIAERAIGLMKLRWRYLTDKLPMRNTRLIPYYIMACCILHNICLKFEDDFEYPIIVPDDMCYDLNPLQLDDVAQREGIRKRNAIKEHFFKIRVLRILYIVK